MQRSCSGPMPPPQPYDIQPGKFRDISENSIRHINITRF